MSMDGRTIEEGDGGPHEFAATLQQKKLARERSREKIRRIVAIVSVALTLLAVLLVTAFLALGSKLEKQAERNANIMNGSGGSPFAEETQRHETASDESQGSVTPGHSSTPSKDLIDKRVDGLRNTR